MMSNFCLKARSQKGCGFSRSGLKTGVENDIVWSEIGSGLGEVGGTSPPGIPRRTPPPPGFRDASLTQSHNELMKALKLALKVKKL